MTKLIDISNQRFGKLFVLCRIKGRRWQCICDCNQYCVVYSYDLKSGHTKSCGCLRREKTGEKRRTHGLSNKIPEYGTWKEIKKRCYNPKHQDYHNYGARGIAVCNRWLNSFEMFYADMGSKPSPSHSIDRINVDGNYEPSNCRWATPKEQRNNQRKGNTQ